MVVRPAHPGSEFAASGVDALGEAALALASVPSHEEADPGRMPAGVRRAAERVNASSILLLPVFVGGEVAGSLELMRDARSFDEEERRLARLAAGQAGLGVCAVGGNGGAARGLGKDP